MKNDMTAMALQGIIDMMRHKMASGLPGKKGRKADGGVITIEVARHMDESDDEPDIKKRLRGLGKL